MILSHNIVLGNSLPSLTDIIGYQSDSWQKKDELKFDMPIPKTILS